MVDPKILLAFRRIDPLNQLSPASQNMLASFSTLRLVRKGETLFCQGEPSPYCFGVLSGELALAYSLPDGTRTVQCYRAGDLLGGTSLIQEMPRRGQASVTHDGEVLSVWSSRFRSVKGSSAENALIIQDIQRVLDASPLP